MTGSDRLAIDEVVCRALGKQPGESIDDAARRIMSKPHGDRRWPIAAAILSTKGEPWDRMKRAAKVARRKGLDS